MKNFSAFKKTLSALCAIALALTASLATPRKISAEETGHGSVWDGSKAESYAGGDGSAESPYLIKTPAQLYKAAYAGIENGSNVSEGKYYRLENNIYLNDVSAADWYTNEGLNEWVKNGSNEVGDFRGIFDGNGYVVHGLYYSDSYTGFAALFPKTGSYSGNPVVIKNVGIEDAYIQGKDAGALIGCADGSRNGKNTITVSGCYADDSVYLKGSESNGLVAWLFNYYFTIEKCASRVRMIGTANTSEPRGSLLGAMFLVATENGCSNVDNAKKITIKNSYAVLTKEDRDAGFSAVPQSWTGRHIRYENVHGGVYPNGSGSAVFTGDSYTLNNQSGCVFVHWPSDFVGSNIFGSEWSVYDGSDYIVPTIFDKSREWNGKAALVYAGGDGSAENPYLIKTPGQLYKAIYAGVENGANVSNGKYYRMENDIYLNDVSNENWYTRAGLREWVKLGDNGVGSFRGTFDGNGHVVHGLYYSDSYTGYAAFIPEVRPMSGNPIVIKNLGIEDAYIQGKDAGAVIGNVDGDRNNADNTVTVSGCYADESVYLKGSNSSGFVAWLMNYYFTIENCASRVRLIGTSNTSEPRGSLLGAMFLVATENGFSNVDNAKKITIKNSYAVLTKEDRGAGFSAVPQSWTGRHIRYENVHGGVFPDGNGSAVFNGDSYTLNNQSGCEFGHWPSDFKGAGLSNGFSSEIWLAGNGSRYWIQKDFAAFEKGDVNRDENVDVLDIIRLKKIASAVGSYSTRNADLDGNGLFNADDLAILRKILLGAI